ncbi:MAG TPA: hypothetical protein VE715_09390 [Blastocatellia bacterium]|nr:hypothetical protein [Blastocatellia bacterium]
MEQMSDYFATKLVGSGVLEEVLRQFELIAEHCKLANNNKLLIDTTGLDIKVSMIDRFLVGERLAIFARYRIKVAFVCRPEQIDSRKFAGLVARNRGVTIESFTDYQAAEEWLLEKPG